eukprot:m.59127 g.59127  ORF g.59127 m.59127 type:complete len:185 (+) comp13206_c0_seq3:196-750(+)
MASCLHGFMLGVLAVLAVQSALYIFSPDIGQPEYGVRRDINADDSAEKSHYPVIIVGAGAAGLSLAGRLQHAGIPYIVFEKDTAGSAWDKRYARLHLHTVRGISELPYWHFPETAPTFVPRDYLAKYYRAYASFHNVKDHTEVEFCFVVIQQLGLASCQCLFQPDHGRLIVCCILFVACWLCLH